MKLNMTFWIYSISRRSEKADCFVSFSFGAFLCLTGSDENEYPYLLGLTSLLQTRKKYSDYPSNKITVSDFLFALTLLSMLKNALEKQKYLCKKILKKISFHPLTVLLGHPVQKYLYLLFLSVGYQNRVIGVHFWRNFLENIQKWRF